LEKLLVPWINAFLKALKSSQKRFNRHGSSFCNTMGTIF